MNLRLNRRKFDRGRLVPCYLDVGYDFHITKSKKSALVDDDIVIELNGGTFSMPNGATFSERQVVIQATEFLRSIVKACWST